MTNVANWRDADFEYSEEITHPVQTHRMLTVRLAAVGGGTLGKAYTGNWAYRVTERKGDTHHVVQQGSDLRCGMPRTHRQMARILEDFLIDQTV